MQWVWDHSRSRNAQRLVLLAIADNAADDGTHAYPSNAEIQRKSALSERGVRTAVAELIKLGELRVEINQGRRGTNMYSVIMTPPTPAESAPRPNGQGAGSAPRPRQNLPRTPADSAPGTVLEPPNEPSSFLPQDAAATNAGKILKGLIDWLRLPEQGPVELPNRIKGMYAKGIKKLLDEGADPIRVKLALGRMHDRGKIGSPSLLDSFVVEVQCRPVSGPPAAPRTFKQMDRADEQAKMKRAEAIDAAMVLIQQQQPQLDWQTAYDLARGEVDSYLDNHPNGLNGSSGTGYSHTQVIDSAGDVVEVTGP